MNWKSRLICSLIGCLLLWQTSAAQTKYQTSQAAATGNKVLDTNY